MRRPGPGVTQRWAISGLWRKCGRQRPARVLALGARSAGLHRARPLNRKARAVGENRRTDGGEVMNSFLMIVRRVHHDRGAIVVSGWHRKPYMRQQRNACCGRRGWVAYIVPRRLRSSPDDCFECIWCRAVVTRRDSCGWEAWEPGGWAVGGKPSLARKRSG